MITTPVLTILEPRSERALDPLLLVLLQALSFQPSDDGIS